METRSKAFLNVLLVFERHTLSLSRVSFFFLREKRFCPQICPGVMPCHVSSVFLFEQGISFESLCATLEKKNCRRKVHVQAIPVCQPIVVRVAMFFCPWFVSGELAFPSYTLPQSAKFLDFVYFLKFTSQSPGQKIFGGGCHFLLNI